MEITHKFAVGSLIANNFEVVKILGEGTFGIVYECVRITTGERVAVKQSQYNPEVEGIPATALREISILKDLKHQNIVKLHQVNIKQAPFIFLVFELLDNDLRDFINKYGQSAISPQQIKSMIYQILKGVQLCHERRYIHRDIKPGNILMGKSGQLKLADFGLSRPYKHSLQPLTEEVVTLWYRAPEILLGFQQYGTPIDIWSIGCIFAELAMGSTLFEGNNNIDQLHKIIKTMGAPTQQQWPEYFAQTEGLSMEKPEDVMEEENYEQSVGSFQQRLLMCGLEEKGKDLLRRMMRLNPASRISAAECLKHSYFN